MKTDILTVETKVGIRDIFRQAMIFLPYSEFAELIRDTVKLSDDPNILAKAICSELKELKND